MFYGKEGDVYCPFCKIDGKLQFVITGNGETVKSQIKCYVCDFRFPSAAGLDVEASKKNAIDEMLKFIEIIEK